MFPTLQTFLSHLWKTESQCTVLSLPGKPDMPIVSMLCAIRHNFPFVQEETSPEEKRRFEEQRMFAQQEERRTRCYAVIGRFFRKMVFFIRLNSKWQHRPWSLRVCCLRQLERELFSPFTVSHGMCGICGVSFCNSLNPLGGTELFEDGLQMKEEVICHFKQNHVQSYDHNQTERDFHQFRMLYRNCLSQPLLQIGCFLNEYEVSDVWNISMLSHLL